MKLYIVIFILIILFGIGMIVFTSVSGTFDTNTGYASPPSGDVLEVQSSEGTIEIPELSFDEVETELYNKDQMYFKYSDGMYNYLKLNQVDTLKVHLQNFIKNNINQDIRECEFDIDSIAATEEDIAFTVIVPGHSSLRVIYLKDGTDTVKITY